MNGGGFRPRFLAPLSFAFPGAAAAQLEQRLLAGPVASSTVALVASSPRGVEALRRALAAAAATASGGAESLRAQWAGTSVFVVGAASAAALHASTPHSAAQPDLARQCGFEAVHSADVRCAAELGAVLRAQWPQLCERLSARAAAAASSSPPQPPSFLALVGDRRRDEMFNVLAGLQADGTPLPSADAGSGAATPIPVEQLVVYETLMAEGAAAASADAVDGTTSAELSTFLQQLLSQLAELDTGSSSGSNSAAALPIYVVFFSPSGVETYFAQTRSAKAAAALAPYAGRIRYACIGQTSAQALGAIQDSAAAAASASTSTRHAPLVAAQPNPTELLRVIAADASARPTAAATGVAAAAAASTAASPSPRPLSPIPARVPFFKYHGTLNDYVLIDGFKHRYTRAQLSRLAHVTGSDRRGAVGSDGLLYVTSGREFSLERLAASPVGGAGAGGADDDDPAKSHVHGRMYMFNTDGSEAEMCGNGLRCVAKFGTSTHIALRCLLLCCALLLCAHALVMLIRAAPMCLCARMLLVYDHKLSEPRPSTLHLLTGAGPKQAMIGADPETGLAASVALDLGVPAVAPSMHLLQGQTPAGTMWTVPVHDISMGNPHCIVLLEPAVTAAAAGGCAASAAHGRPENSLHGLSLEQVDVPVWGQRLHDHARYSSSNGTNVSFVSVRDGPPSASAVAAAAAVGTPSPSLTVDIRTYERGNGETWSCGSGISASVCSVLTRRRRRAASPRAAGAGAAAESYKETVRVFVRGGQLSVTCTLADRDRSADAGGDSFLFRDVLRVELSGPATEVYEGTFPVVLDD